MRDKITTKTSGLFPPIARLARPSLVRTGFRFLGEDRMSPAAPSQRARERVATRARSPLPLLAAREHGALAVRSPLNCSAALPLEAAAARFPSSRNALPASKGARARTAPLSRGSNSRAAAAAAKLMVAGSARNPLSIRAPNSPPTDESVSQRRRPLAMHCIALQRIALCAAHVAAQWMQIIAALQPAASARVGLAAAACRGARWISRLNPRLASRADCLAGALTWLVQGEHVALAAGPKLKRQTRPVCATRLAPQSELDRPTIRALICRSLSAGRPLPAESCAQWPAARLAAGCFARDKATRVPPAPLHRPLITRPKLNRSAGGARKPLIRHRRAGLLRSYYLVGRWGAQVEGCALQLDSRICQVRVPLPLPARARAFWPGKEIMILSWVCAGGAIWLWAAEFNAINHDQPGMRRLGAAPSLQEAATQDLGLGAPIRCANESWPPVGIFS